MRPADFGTKVPKILPRSEYEKMPKAEAPTPLGGAKSFASNIVASFSFADFASEPNPDFVGRQNEVDSVVETLYKKRMRNVILVGNAGVGKTEIAKKAMSAIGDKEVFLCVNLGELNAGCTLVGMFEERLGSFLKKVCAWNSDERHKVKISLFIDEIHSLWRLNSNEHHGTVPASDMLKPYLSDGTVTIIGTTTVDEYERFVKNDKALLRRISPVFVRELPDDATLDILRRFCENRLTDEQMAAIVHASKSIGYLSNPDRSIEIADRLMARAAFRNRKPTKQDLTDVIESMRGREDA